MMCIFHEYVEINSADYSDSGYIPLYPLLNRYWDKPLAEMPQKLRFRVEKAVPSWDKIDSSYRSINDSVSQLTLRQKCVFLYDIKRDPTQEWETYIALEGYIRGGYSPAEYPLGGYTDISLKLKIVSIPKAAKSSATVLLQAAQLFGAAVKSSSMSTNMLRGCQKGGRNHEQIFQENARRRRENS